MPSGLLTRRQQWRRVKHEKNSSDIMLGIGSRLHESSSEPRLIRNTIFESMSFLRSLSAPLYTTTPNSTTKVKKSVSFNRRVVRVILIPTKEEMIEATAKEPLWWAPEEYTVFKNEAVAELKYVMSSHVNMDSKMSLKFLYQPEFDGLLIDHKPSSSTDPQFSVSAQATDEDLRSELESTQNE